MDEATEARRSVLHYEQAKDAALADPTEPTRSGAAQSGAPEPKEPEPKEPEPTEPTEPKPKRRGRPKKGEGTNSRRDCPDCGKSLSVATRNHTCYVKPPTESSDPSAREDRSGAAQSGAPESLERPITLTDVSNFLFAEVKARRDSRRDRMSASMF